MTNDSTRIVVTQVSCHTCGSETVEVHHQSLPEMRASGASLVQAAERLLRQLGSVLDAVADPLHRDPVQRAIADTEAFLLKENTVDNLQDS